MAKKFRYSLDAGLTWTTVDVELPYRIPGSEGKDVIVEPLGPMIIPTGALPVPPSGFVFLLDTDGAYLVDQDGAYLVEPL